MTRITLLGLPTLLLACQAVEPSGDPPSPEPPVTCGTVAGSGRLRDSCDAMDARALPDPEAGPCDCSLGYAWDGVGCVHLADCFCEGQDCDELFQDREACESAHAECTAEPPVTTGEPLRLSCNDEGRFREEADGPSDGTSCAPMDATGIPDPEAGACDCSLGYAWSGTSCIHLGNCFCEGDDCDKLFRDLEECTAAHPSSCPGNPELARAN